MTSAEAAALRDLVLSGKAAAASLDPRKLAAAYVAIRSADPAGDLAISTFAQNWRAAAPRRSRSAT